MVDSKLMTHSEIFNHMQIMENLMKYKNFVGSVQYNADDKVFHGKLEFITDLVTFEGTSVSELEAAFKRSSR